jgi:hypothetical protein
MRQRIAAALGTEIRWIEDERASTTGHVGRARSRLRVGPSHRRGWTRVARWWRSRYADGDRLRAAEDGILVAQRIERHRPERVRSVFATASATCDVSSAVCGARGAISGRPRTGVPAGLTYESILDPASTRAIGAQTSTNGQTTCRDLS